MRILQGTVHLSRGDAGPSWQRTYSPTLGVVVLVMLACVVPMTPSAAATFTGLGFGSVAEDVSADGSVVVGGGNYAFRWTPSGGMQDLGTLPPATAGASAVADDGEVVVGGTATISYGQAFRWTQATGMVGLGLGTGAHGISGNGEVIVGSFGGQAAQWGGSGVLGDLPGGSTYSVAHAASYDGSAIVGCSSSALSSLCEAFRWTAGEGMDGLGDLPGGSVESYAFDVSDDGSAVVGWSRSQEGPEAFRWTEETGMVGLGDLAGPEGGFDSRANAVSGDGLVVVGTSVSAAGKEAMIWDPHRGMRSLKDVLTNVYGLDLTNWTLTEARAISSDGRAIVGDGDHVTASGSHVEAWLAVIPPQSHPTCSNAFDDDEDGLADYPADPGCRNAAFDREDPECDDGIDNDGDGKKDMLDPECRAASDRSERVDCSDGIDNDGDGYTDTADPGCLNSGWPYEDPECSDGVDNDSDGLIDWNGGGVGSPDPQCAAPNGFKERPSTGGCGLGVELVLVASLMAWHRNRRRH